MNFTADRKSLKSALERVKDACKKSAVTCTTCVKLSLTNSILFLTGYDLETGITTQIEVETGFADGNIYDMLVECSKFLEIISKQTGGDVSITFDDVSRIMTIKSGRSSCRIPTLSAEDYPNIPEFESNDKITVKSDILADMIRQTIFAVSVNDNKPILTGECFTLKGENLEIAAVDGYRLAVRTESVINYSVSSNYKDRFVVKADALRSVLKLAKSDSDMNIIPCRKHVIFDFGETKLFSRLLEGDFHNYDSSIPKTSTTEATIEVKPVIEALERFALLVNDKAKAPLCCEFSSGIIEMSLKSSIGEMQDTIGNVDFFGNDVRIGFNCRFLLDSLKAAETDKVKLHLNGGVSPMLITPIDGEAFKFLVLPLRLKN